MGTKHGDYYSPWANLAAAIIESGKKCNDQRFLQSDWCDTLRSICRLDDEMHGNRNIGVRGKSRISTAHMEVGND